MVNEPPEELASGWITPQEGVLMDAECNMTTLECYHQIHNSSVLEQLFNRLNT